ncbi:MAG: hypothetical protein IJ566_02340, partial [Cardiobacteriaceae bacterium]|nr:hypothetical protein [Cardiobacteriaceae bacterium]
ILLGGGEIANLTSKIKDNLLLSSIKFANPDRAIDIVNGNLSLSEDAARGINKVNNLAEKHPNSAGFIEGATALTGVAAVEKTIATNLVKPDFTTPHKEYKNYLVSEKFSDSYANTSIASKVDNATPVSAVDTVPTSRPDYYVKPNGDVVPSTGYRYMNSIHTEKTMETMNSGEGKDYFGFNKYDTGSAARDAYQIAPKWSDARLRGEFDTLQVIDDMRVPKTFGDEGPDLEPFTTSYPQYGKGGELQFIYDKGYIKFDKVDLLEDK